MERKITRFNWKWFICFWSLASACAGTEGYRNDAVVSCSATSFRYPTTREDFLRLYSGRGFYADGNHLGRDILLAEGTPIHPIACGTIRVYRAAQGYGTLVVVIEHRFPEPRGVRNGAGDSIIASSFLSIYGHLRPSANRAGRQEMAFRSGDIVGPEDIIGYVEQDEFNGDGGEHLHLGIRLQTASDASQTDDAWFRGYDTTPSQKQWFANPETFLAQSMRMGTSVTWHPPGSVLEYGRIHWFVGQEEFLHSVEDKAFAEDRLAPLSVLVNEREMGCFLLGLPYVPWRGVYKLVKFPNASTVYEYRENPPTRYTFISQEAFDSWGWNEAEIELRPADQLNAFLGRYQDGGLRRIRDGTLVKGTNGSEVSVVSDGRRLPIFDWQTYLSMGYEGRQIYSIDGTVIDQVAAPRGPVITTMSVGYCARTSGCHSDACGNPGTMDASTVRDLGVAQDLTIGRDMSAPKTIEICNGKDDDNNGQVDETFLCPLGKRGGFCLTACGAPGYLVCEAPACNWGSCHTYPEDCTSSIDEDCDGKIDCADTDCLMDPRCGVSPDMAVPVPRGFRYEFRVLDFAGWQATEPYQLRNQWWVAQTCLNTGTDLMQRLQDGWYRCDVAASLPLFVGSFFSQAHPDWGDQGKLGTVGNSPAACTPTAGTEWNVINLDTGRGVYLGPSAGLPCVSVAGQSRHALP